MENTHPQPHSAKKSRRNLILPIFLLLLLAGAAGVAYYYYTQYQHSQLLLKDPSAASKIEIQSVTASLKKLMDLPTDEEPTIATIMDKEKLKDQPFFAKAENGDKVIIYTKAGKAILFRVSANRIIDVAPINLGQSAATINVAVYNGSGTVGLAKSFAENLKQVASNVIVVSQETAKKAPYAQSLVVDLTGSKPELAKQMAELIGGTVGTLPEGEVKPAAAAGTSAPDLLVIIGGNYKPVPVTTGEATQPAAKTQDDTKTTPSVSPTKAEKSATP